MSLLIAYIVLIVLNIALLIKTRLYYVFFCLFFSRKSEVCQKGSNCDTSTSNTKQHLHLNHCSRKLDFRKGGLIYILDLFYFCHVFIFFWGGLYFLGTKRLLQLFLFVRPM